MEIHFQVLLKHFLKEKDNQYNALIKLQTINEKGMNKISELLNELEIEHCSYQYTPKNLKHSKVYIIFINKKEARKNYFNRIGFVHNKKYKKLKETLNL